MTVQTNLQDTLDRVYLNGLTTTRSKIRYLASLNFTRTEISNILFVRYQHVRNELETMRLQDLDKKTKKK